MIINDRIKQITTTAGLGSYTTSGIYDGYQGFNTIADGEETYYCCQGGTAWEVGKGTVGNSGTTITRDEILSSSDGGTAIDWPVGDKVIFCDFPAAALMALATECDKVEPHLQDNNNPHNVTAEQIGGVTMDDVIAMAIALG